MRWRRVVLASVAIVFICLLLNVFRNSMTSYTNTVDRVNKNADTYKKAGSPQSNYSSLSVVNIVNNSNTRLSTQVEKLHHVQAHPIKSSTVKPHRFQPRPIQDNSVKLHQIQPRPVQGSAKHNVHVIIISRWKYGSSFTGDILNKNPDFSYFYEPLRGKMYEDNNMRAKVIHQDQITMLHDILKCEFTDRNYTWWDANDTKMNCWKSQKFDKSVLCEHFVNTKGTVRRYEKKTSRMVEEICRSGKHVAIKTVRVPDLKHLKSIVTDDSLNVKVIQLVRDVRAVYLSRMLWNGGCDMELSECDELKNNLNYWKDPPSWLKGRYMLLRYEDLADDPIGTVQIIYDFLGLPVPVTVKTWLQINSKEMSLFVGSAYTWRAIIDYSTIIRVQKHCMETLLMTGYKAINSIKDLKDFKVPTIEKYPYPLMPNMTYEVSNEMTAN
ncbi:carbohydrate sulfotransferase 1-like [Amphiura filiformis]|uniref:carbohydrate sulfotransferase 1-like n=1 Tax=Amphiura filiformis TaxID=82378 RepID=UPI003B215E61